MITYVETPTGIVVKLEGKVVGNIKCNADGYYYYQPKGSKAKGQEFNSAAAVKLSLESGC